MTWKLLTAAAILLAMAHTNARAGVVLDLTTADANGTVNGTAVDWFQQVPDQSTGTGVINPFARIQANGSESGYNTDGTPQFDTKVGTWTHSLNVSDVPIVNIGGVDYRQFLLDINQNKGSNGEFLSLNSLEIYLGTTTNFIGTTGFGTGTAGAGTLVYSLDATMDNTIELNFLLNPGSGAGDMFAYIAESSFQAAFTGSNPYVYLYSSFGDPNNSNDGFEEWAVVGTGGGPPVPPAAAPEPSTIALALSGLIPLAVAGYRRRRAAKV